jgi:hypothetical protein
MPPTSSAVRFTIGAGGASAVPGPRVGRTAASRQTGTPTRDSWPARPGTLTSLHLDVVWQAELSAGIVFRLQ